MKLTDQLITVADAYGQAKGLSRARVSTIVFNQGRVLDRVAEGDGITVKRFEAAMAWFAAHWPEDTAWPAGIERPSVGDVSDVPPLATAAGAA